MLLESQIKQNSYWASECVLEVYFYTFDELNNEQSVRRHLDQVWICVRRFVRASEPREEEQTLWARIAILQTFCEGALSVCSEKEQLHGHDGWSFPKIMPILRNLVDQAISRDESGEWSHSRGFIRQQLIELDQEVMADHAYMNNALCFKRYETLLGLWKMADTNEGWACLSCPIKSTHDVHIQLRIRFAQPTGTSTRATIPSPRHPSHVQAFKHLQSPTYSQKCHTPIKICGRDNMAKIRLVDGQGSKDKRTTHITTQLNLLAILATSHKRKRVDDKGPPDKSRDIDLRPLNGFSSKVSDPVTIGLAIHKGHKTYLPTPSQVSLSCANERFVLGIQRFRYDAEDIYTSVHS
jgi:hypothetical protein